MGRLYCDFIWLMKYKTEEQLRFFSQIHHDIYEDKQIVNLRYKNN